MPVLISFFCFAFTFVLNAQDPPLRTPKKFVIPSSETAFPMRLIKKRPYVRACINGSEPFWFLLDTGTTTNIIRDWVVRKKNLPVRSATSKAYGFAGITKTDKVCRIEHLKLGDAEFSGFDADIQPDDSEVWEQIGDKKIAGVLGFKLFAKCLLTLDYLNCEIKLSKSSLSSKDANVISFFDTSSSTNLDNLPIVPMHAGDKTFPAVLDSGFISTLTIPDPLLGELAPHQPVAEIPQILIYGAGGKSQNMRYVRVLQTLGLGHYNIMQPPAMVAQPLGALKVGFIIVGGELLQNFSITFDQKQRLVRLNRSSDISSNVIDYTRTILRIRHFNLQFGESFWTVPIDITVQNQTLFHGDLIFLVDDEPVFKMTREDWDLHVRSRDKIHLTILRDGKLVELDFPLVFLPSSYKD